MRFLYDGSYEDFKETLFGLGQTPVPDWVKTDITPEDAENFQTIFAKHEGAVSAPAAGLHFSRELFNRMILKDINKAFITLHMGIGHSVKWTWRICQNIRWILNALSSLKKQRSSSTRQRRKDTRYSQSASQ